MSMGLSSLWVLLVLGGGNTGQDLAAWIQTDDYFQSRKVEVRTETMLKLAAVKPTTGREAIGQLLALRWLGEHRDEAAKDGRVVALLRQVADGKVGEDPLGFAPEYARQALARLDGKALERPAAANGLRDGFGWFPGRASLLAGIDLRQGLADPETASKIRDLARNQMEPEVRELIYKFADSVGNVRIDRITVALAATGADKAQVFVRISGKVSRERLTNEILQFKEFKGATATGSVGPGGEPITRITGEEPVFGVYLVGDSELVFAADKAGTLDATKTLLQEVQSVHAGKAPSVLNGEHKLLEGTPANAALLVSGNLDKKLRQEAFAALPAAFPTRFHLSMVRGKTIDLAFGGESDEEAEAKALAEQMTQFKELGLTVGVKAVADELKLPEKTAVLARKALESVNVKADGKKVVAVMQIPGELPGLLLAAMLEKVKQETKPLK